MKKLLILLTIATIFASCEKEKEHENLCPVISEKFIPSVVLGAFHEKYPNMVAEHWFNKDNAGYCVSFTLNSEKTLSLFNNDGSFLREETHVNHDGQHEDGDDDSGCECETEDGD